MKRSGLSARFDSSPSRPRFSTSALMGASTLLMCCPPWDDPDWVVDTSVCTASLIVLLAWAVLLNVKRERGPVRFVDLTLVWVGSSATRNAIRVGAIPCKRDVIPIYIVKAVQNTHRNWTLTEWEIFKRQVEEPPGNRTNTKRVRVWS